VIGGKYFKAKAKIFKFVVFLAFRDIQQFDCSCFPRKKKPEGDFFFFFVSEWQTCGNAT